MDDSGWCRSSGVPDERHVDAGSGEQSLEHLAVAVTSQRPEECDVDAEPSEGDRRVERPAARHRLGALAVVDDVDKRFAADDDQATSSGATSSPEPRAISRTGCT
jgi:hypothetical protein